MELFQKTKRKIKGKKMAQGESKNSCQRASCRLANSSTHRGLGEFQVSCSQNSENVLKTKLLGTFFITKMILNKVTLTCSSPNCKRLFTSLFFHVRHMWCLLCFLLLSRCSGFWCLYPFCPDSFIHWMCQRSMCTEKHLTGHSSMNNARITCINGQCFSITHTNCLMYSLMVFPLKSNAWTQALGCPFQWQITHLL